MQKIDGRLILSCGAIVSPLGWSGNQKMGLNLAGIHMPVPHFNDGPALKYVSKIFERGLKAEVPLSRANWFIMHTGELSLVCAELETVCMLSTTFTPTIVLCCAVSHLSVCWVMSCLCCAVLCCAMLCCALLCCATLCYTALCCAVLCRAVLCRAVLCHAVLCHDVQACLWCFPFGGCCVATDCIHFLQCWTATVIKHHTAVTKAHACASASWCWCLTELATENFQRHRGTEAHQHRMNFMYLQL